MIHLQRVNKRYGKFHAVRELDLEIRKGELFGFLGPNGAGKTTTLRMIAGILAPTSGTIEIGGIDITRDPLGAKAKLGYIPDRPFVYDKLTGAEFLRFTAALFGWLIGYRLVGWWQGRAEVEEDNAKKRVADVHSPEDSAEYRVRVRRPAGQGNSESPGSPSSTAARFVCRLGPSVPHG